MERMTDGVFYKLRDKELSKESAYVLVGFLARPFVSFVSHIARWQVSGATLVRFTSPSARRFCCQVRFRRR